MLFLQGANVPTAKPGQSPFIPGPSRQILEGLMKENSDLKKTVSNLTGKVHVIFNPMENVISYVHCMYRSCAFTKLHVHTHTQLYL